MTPLELNMLYLHSNSMGYGRMGMHVAAEMEKLGVHIYDHLSPDGPVPDAAAYVRDAVAGPNAGRSKVILWLTVPTHARGWWKGQTPCILTMWEAMTLPESFRETIDNFDTVIVPSPQNLELFSEFHPNVKYVPLGVDPVRWAPRRREMPTTEFRFLIGGSGLRKGTDLAVKAFKKLWPRGTHFGDKPIPTLTLKNPRGENFYGERIHMVSGKISDNEETDLYYNAHCYLQPSRGEGFGLQPLQAIASGCPTILTDAHGHGSYAHLGLGLESKPSEAAYFVYGDAGQWWEPNFDQLCQRMENVYENYAYHRSNAYIFGKVACREFTWENTAKGIIEAIGPERMTAYDGPEEWFQPTVKLFPIITNCDHVHEVAGHMYSYRQGKEYYEVADVKRILFEAGKLDPACLDSGGLAPEQVEKLGKYRAAYEHCPTCGKPLQEPKSWPGQLTVTSDPNGVVIGL